MPVSLTLRVVLSGWWPALTGEAVPIVPGPLEVACRLRGPGTLDCLREGIMTTDQIAVTASGVSAAHRIGRAAGEDDAGGRGDEMMCLPAPPPEMVHAARGYLTPRYAVGVDAFLWEAREHPMSDLDAIEAVIAASDRAQSGTGEPPELMELAAALVVLGAARLEADQREVRLLNAAQASGVGWVQIAAILELSVQEAEERYRQLKPRLDEPVATSLHPLQRAPR